MARIILDGPRARVELTHDQEEGGIIATCLGVACSWTERYDDLNDATEYAGTEHADRGREHVDPPADAIAELKELEARDRAAGGPPWEVPDHPDHNLPGGWHRGQIN